MQRDCIQIDCFPNLPFFSGAAHYPSSKNDASFTHVLPIDPPVNQKCCGNMHAWAVGHCALRSKSHLHLVNLAF